MLTTLIGTLFGGLFRMAPEVLNWFDKKDDRKHELDMFNLQIEADKLKGEQQLAVADSQLGVTEMQAIIEATKAQSVVTGVKWVDAINALMRPVITFWWVIVMYTGALVAQYLSLLQEGINGLSAVISLWGPDEKAIVASIISFWFVDRSLRKK